jgi:hypothetical protein
MKLKKKNSGSVKIDPEVLKMASDYCQKYGLKVGNFVTRVVKEKLDSIIFVKYP